MIDILNTPEFRIALTAASVACLGLAWHWTRQNKRAAGEKAKTGPKTLCVRCAEIEATAEDAGLLPGSSVIMQTLARGYVDAQDARRMLEHAPKFAALLRERLAVIHGTVSEERFVELARFGAIGSDTVERAIR